MLSCVLCICSNGRDQKWLLNYPEWETCTGICTRQMYTGICLWVLGIQHWFSGREASSLNSMASLQYLNLYFNNVVKLHFKCVCVCVSTHSLHTHSMCMLKHALSFTWWVSHLTDTNDFPFYKWSMTLLHSLHGLYFVALNLTHPFVIFN